MKKEERQGVALRIIQGAAIGAGAILPGVSGGVLCAAFGLYVPLMNLLANPLREIKKSYRMWISVGVGWVLGFLLFAGVLLAMFEASENVAMALFAGLIIGTLPALFREAGKEETKFKNAKYFCMCIFFCLSFLMFVLLGLAEERSVEPGFVSYLVCGGVLGLSFIIPGLTSSSILMHIGLYTPMVEGIAGFDFSVIIPIFIGIAAVVISLAKLVKKLFSVYYTEAYYAVIGVVVSSTLVIIPRSFVSVTESVMCLAVGILGAALSFFADKKLSVNC